MDIKPNLVYEKFETRSSRSYDANNQPVKTPQNLELTVRELKDNVSLEQAVAATEHNGLDEVFFESEGKNYVAYGTLDVGDTAELKTKLASGKFGDKNIKVLQFTSEANFVTEGFVQSAKALGNAVSLPFRYLKFPNAATSATFIGGMAAGALSQLPGSFNLKAGLAMGGVGGAATIRFLTDNKNPDDTNRTLKSGATGLASVALGAAIPHTVKFIANTSVPQALASSAKMVAMTALVGSAIALTGGAFAGGLSKPNYQSLEKISE